MAEEGEGVGDGFGEGVASFEPGVNFFFLLGKHLAKILLCQLENRVALVQANGLCDLVRALFTLLKAIRNAIDIHRGRRFDGTGLGRPYERNIYPQTTLLNRSDNLLSNFFPNHLENP